MASKDFGSRSTCLAPQMLAYRGAFDVTCLEIIKSMIYATIF